MQQFRHPVSLLVAIVVTGILVFVACFLAWHHLGGGAWRSAVAVVDAELRSPDGLVLIIASCNGGPGVTLTETDIDVRVKAVAYSTPLRGGADCLDAVGPRHLQQPLGDRVVVDMHTGRIVLNRAEVELDSHLSLWQQARSGDYSYEYNVLCECSDNFGQPVKVTVTNGVIESVVYAESGELVSSGDPPVISGSPRYHTIDRLFDVIQEAIDNEADQITVSYDSEFGYPTNIDIDRNINAIDDEYVLTATRFLPR